jgi:hypothetical protein
MAGYSRLKEVMALVLTCTKSDLVGYAVKDCPGVTVLLREGDGFFQVAARCGLSAHPSNAGVARLGYLLPPLFSNIPLFIVGFSPLGMVAARPTRGASCSLLPVSGSPI